jgi:FKBP-type peptidyl-prolyl cis-trans isomerase
MIKRFFILITITLVITLSWSCEKPQAEQDKEAIEKYISDNNLNAVQYENSGMYYVIKKAGGSSHPNTYSEITVNYDGYLLDGTKFDSGKKVKLYLGQTIYGWKLGIPLIGEGGTIKLIIPSALAYGSRSTDNIPANSVLVFDVDLVLFN